MGEDRTTGAVDVVRWTFSADPERSPALEDYLADLGLDVSVRDGGQFVVLWDEPGEDCDYDAVVEELWALNGAPFEITHETFGRLDLLVFHPTAQGSGDPERAVA